jgi:hypothetical protein
MGKSDEKQTKTSAHKATDGVSFDTLGSKSLFETPFEDNDTALRRHSDWRDLFRQLCEYKVRFGHCLVPQRYSANPKLGRWVMRQRINYRFYTVENSSVMAAEHIRALDGVGFNWGTSKTDLTVIWNARIQELREFKVQFGHCLVPLNYSADPKLGRWVANQRSSWKVYHQRGKPSPMTAERMLELESVGFEWRPNYDTWNERFEQLREFKVHFGNCLVPSKYSANPKLGRWVSKQRSMYRLCQEGKPSHITAERIRELESIGFKWNFFPHYVFATTRGVNSILN